MDDNFLVVFATEFVDDVGSVVRSDHWTSANRDFYAFALMFITLYHYNFYVTNEWVNDNF